eukprot:scaffold539119_cov42-Prasinocladus_malaysianus.AAC.2
MHASGKENLQVVLVSAVALFDEEGRVLLAQRPEGKSMAGKWEFPGGKVIRPTPIIVTWGLSVYR